MAAMDGPDSSKLSGSRALLRLPRRGAAIWIGILLAISLLLTTGLVFVQKLNQAYLLLGYFLPVLLACYFKRFIYLPALILVAAVNGFLLSLRGVTLQTTLVVLTGLGLAALIS